MKSKQNIVIIGAGWQCEERHIPAFKPLKNIILFGVIDINEERAKAVAQKYKIPHYSAMQTVNDIEWFAEIDAVVICSPAMTHYGWIRQSLLAGKHVLAEKPISDKREHAQELLDLAKEKNVMLCFVHNFICARAYKKAQKWIASNKIGAITGMYNTFLSNPKRQHISPYYDDLPLMGFLQEEVVHLIYQTEALSKNLRINYAACYPSRCGNVHTPSKAYITFRTDDFPVFFTIDYESPLTEHHCVIQGEKGVIAIDTLRDVCLFIPNDRRHTAMEYMRTSFAVICGHMTGVFKSGVLYLRHKLLYGIDDIARCFATMLHNTYSQHAKIAIDAKTQQYISGEFGIRIFNLLCDVVEMLEKNKDTIPFSSQLPTPKLGTQ